MGFEEEGTKEKSSGKSSGKSPVMTLQKAVDLGEYEPDYLATFSEWSILSRHVQFQFIKEGLENRRRQLIQQWAEISNVLDFRLKPNLKIALKNIEKQLKKLSNDKERLYLEYSS